MIFNSFPDPNRTTLPPANYRRGKEVREYVEHYAKSQQIEQEEALQVQGSDILIWNRVYTPRFCTCQGLDSVINNNPAVINDVRPSAIAQQKAVELEQIQQGSVRATFKSKQQLNNIIAEGALGGLSSIVDSLYDTPEIEEATPTIISKESLTQSSILEEAFLKQKANLGVEYTEYVNCPICFGTKHADAYQPHRGVRLVLDASDFYPIVLNKAQISKNEYPFRFKFLDDSASVTWKVTLPKYFKAVSVKAYNMERESTSVQLSISTLPTSNFTPLTAASLQARSGLNNNVMYIKSTVNRNNISAYGAQLELNLTHVELVLLYSDIFDKGELPMLTIPEQIDYQELYLRSRVVLSPKVSSLNRGDLICENKYGLLWQVVDVEKLYTSGGTLMNLRADIRLIQNSEKLYNLAMFARKLNTVRPDLYGG